jgi:hypothetical protein
VIADPTADRREPVEAIPVETRTENPLLTALAWTGVALVVLVIGWWVWTRWISPPVGGTIARWVGGEGVVFESPADQFGVTMPTKYTRRTSTNEWGEIVTVSSNPGGGYFFSATKTPQPSSTLADYKKTMPLIARSLAKGKHARIVSESKPIPFVDIGLSEIVYERDGTYWRVRLMLLPDRLYTLIAQAPNDSTEPYERLTSSFRILGER